MGLSIGSSDSGSTGGISFSGSSSVDDTDPNQSDLGVLSLLKSSDFSSLLTSAQKKISDKAAIQQAGGLGSSLSSLTPGLSPELDSLTKSVDINAVSERMYEITQDPVLSAKYNITPAQKEAITQAYSGIATQLDSLKSNMVSLQNSISSLGNLQALSPRERDSLSQKMASLKEKSKQVHLTGILAMSEALTSDQFINLLEAIKSPVAEKPVVATPTAGALSGATDTLPATGA